VIMEINRAVIMLLEKRSFKVSKSGF
jgi:hypothetical protein